MTGTLDRKKPRSSLVKGRLVTRTWTHFRSESEVPLAETVETRGGRGFLSRDPVGFPHVVTLTCPERLIPEAGKIRLMKAISLAVEAAAGPGARRADHRIDIVVVDGPGKGRPGARVLDHGLSVRVPAAWLSGNAGSIVAVRKEAVRIARASAGKLGPARRPAASGPGHTARERRPVVLLFRNIFTKDVESGDARQVNPGVHYLASSLIAAGAKVILLGGKIPLQDVCRTPPDASERLPLGECLDDPGELERALDGNPDLDLVCFTVLERSFAQVREISRFVRERSKALVAVGGVFPTVTPEHCFVHLPDAGFVVRGDGEIILPEIARVVAGHRAGGGLDAGALGNLSGLDGLLVRSGDLTMASRIDLVNRVPDLDGSALTFDFFGKENVENGLSLSTSRGCLYSCRFCSVMDKKLWRGRSAGAVMRDLRSYKLRLREIYGSDEDVPASAMSLQIWDDDFFMDAQRARRLLGQMVSQGFTTTFVQGTVSSFFRKRGRRISRDLDVGLLDSIPRAFFTGIGGIKIGTESFSDRELRRLGKPYDFDRIRKLAIGLGSRGLKQDHYMILCNRSTSLEDLLEGFERIAELRWAAGPGFSVLEPSWLINLFPTALYRACQVSGTDTSQPTAGTLSIQGYQEFDYPFVLPERPAAGEVFEVVRRFPAGMHYGAAGDPDGRFEGVYGPDDPAYLRLFPQVRRVLAERLQALDRGASPADGGERFRIEQAMARHLGGGDWLPRGVLHRVAPALAGPVDPLETSRALASHVESLLTAALPPEHLRREVRAVPEGVETEVEIGGTRISMLVQRKTGGRPAAFCTRNLAVVVREIDASPEARDRLSRALGILESALVKHDTHDLG